MTTTLIAGLPRAGTTLLCALLNEMPDTLALAEPMDLTALTALGDIDRGLAEVDAFVTETRVAALAGRPVPAQLMDGGMTDNFAEAPRADNALRKVLAQLGTIRVTKPLSPDFHLLIKHPAFFSAIAHRLQARYPVVAVVRHPLAVLAAWQTVRMFVNRGRLPMAEAFRPELRAALEAIPGILERQVKLIETLLNWYTQTPALTVLRYEDLIADPRGTLSGIAANAGAPQLPVHAYDPKTRYPGVDLRRLARALSPIGPVVERFYPDFRESLAPYLS